MKKHCFTLFFLTLVCFLYSQTVNLMPKEVYVGDEAEIHYSFDWDGTLFSENAQTEVSMVTSSTIDESLDSSYTIKSMQLYPNQTGYTLSIVVIPWESGALDLVAFDLATIFDLSVNSLLIDIPEVYIESILSNTNERNVRPPVGPVIIPGTTYAIIAFVMLLLLVCVLIIIVIARLALIKEWLKSFFGKIWASDNFKKVSRELIVLSKGIGTIDPKVFAAKLSVIIRTYLEGRFSHRFTAETTSSFFVIFDTLFAGTVSDKAESFLQDLYEVCVRCDFLHYAGSEVEKAPLSTQEAHSLIEKTQKAVIYFEKDSDNDSTEEGGGV